MAWIIGTKPLPRWTVGTKTAPDKQLLLKEELAYRYEDPKGRTPFGGSIFQQGLEVPLRLFPREAHVLSSTQSPPDILNIRGWAISERLKELIDRLEPNVHQFVPVPTFLRNGSPSPREYFMANLGHVATRQIDNERTTLRRKPNGKIEPPSVDGERGSIVIHRAQTRGWHAWFSADIYDLFTISDELQALLKAAKIPGIDFTYLVECEQGVDLKSWLSGEVSSGSRRLISKILRWHLVSAILK